MLPFTMSNRHIFLTHLSVSRSCAIIEQEEPLTEGRDMKEQSSFGALLKRYRLTAGLSQEGLAARASLSARTISDLERGVHGTPHADTLALLTGALALSAQQHALLLGAARPELAASLEAPPDSFSPGFPFPPTRLIGRSQEHAYALDLLRRSETHLLTLTGPSGVGKTR